MKTRTILVLTDFSGKAAHAADYAMRLAEKFDADILLYNAFWVPPVMPAETGTYPYYMDYPLIEKENLAQVSRFGDDVKHRFLAKHRGAKIVDVKASNDRGTLGDTIRDLVRRRNIWLIVMGDKRPDNGLSRFLFGSACFDVIDKARCPVLLVPEDASMEIPKNIVFASDLKLSERRAFDYVVRFADALRAGVTVQHVVTEAMNVWQKMDNFDRYRRLASGSAYADISYMDLRGDDVAGRLERYAVKSNIDLMALVHRKRSAIGNLLHASISKKMMNYHRVPLLVLPGR